MKGRILLAVGLALAMLPAPAMASHMGQYRNNPVEHDALGTVLEPDGLSTSVLGPTVGNCVLDLPPFDGRCTADPVPRPAGSLGSAIAPGCTGGANERRIMGQCGLWTVGGGAAGAGVVPPPVSEQGMAGNAAPGAYTPTKGSVVRFLDGRITTTIPQLSGTYTVDVNRHVSELERHTGLSGLGGHVFPGSTFVWAWYGQWADLNGNGVVDHHQPNTAGPTANEFAFLGSCTNFDGERDPQTIDRGLCIEEGNPNLEPPGAPCADPNSIVGCAGASMHAWIFPGNHHPSGDAGDVPGNQVVSWALFVGNCAGPPSCDDIDRDLFGDPLLGIQDEVSDDFDFHDRTGDADDTVRQWSFGLGGVTYFYGDDGLLVTMQQVYGVDCAPSAGATRRALETCVFTDVDRQTTVSTDAQDLLVGTDDAPNGGLKASARATWLIVRDSAGTDTLQRSIDAATGSQDLYLASQGPLRGQVDDLAVNSGWSREPNAPGDVYVATRHAPCSAIPVGDPRNPTAALDPEELEAQHRGWCNVGAGGLGTAYAEYRERARGFFDVQLVRSAVYGVPVSLVPGQSCQYCVWGSPYVGLPYDPEPTAVPPATGDHARTLGPGGYWFGGVMGTWLDRPATRDESLFPDPAGTTLVTYPADGWVGLVERASGQWRYRGYLPLECTTEKDGAMGASVHEAAECNPYLDGNFDDPQDYTLIANGGEFTDGCNEANLFLRLAPADGEMDTQVIVWRNHGQGLQPDPLDLNGDGNAQTLPTLEAYGPGPVPALTIGATCFGQFFQHTAYMLWPAGNTGDVIVTRMTQAVQLGDVDGDGLLDADVITDEDVYAPYEPL